MAIRKLNRRKGKIGKKNIPPWLVNGAITYAKNRGPSGIWHDAKNVGKNVKRGVKYLTTKKKVAPPTLTGIQTQNTSFSHKNYGKFNEVKKVGRDAICNYQVNLSSFANSNVGYQAVTNLNAIPYSTGDILNCVQQQAGAFSEYVLISTGSYSGAGSSNAFDQIPYSINLGHCKSKVKIINPNEFETSFMLYTLSPRQQEVQSGAIIEGQSLTQSSPVGDMNNGLLYETPFSALGNPNVLNNYLIPDTTPFQSRKFCQKWKIENVLTKSLAPGSSHEHEEIFNGRKSLPYADLWQEGYTTTGNTYMPIQPNISALKGLTRRYMLIHIGSIGDNSPSNNDVATIATYAPARLDIVQSLTYKMGFKQTAVETFTYNDYLNTTANLVLSVVNPISGLVVTGTQGSLEA